jgi:cation transport ATPase
LEVIRSEECDQGALHSDLNVDTLVSIAAIAATSVGAYREAATVIFIMLWANSWSTSRLERLEEP